MDRWKIADIEALALIGHEGGLTKKGTRPRFKLVDGEVDAFLGLQEIETAMAPLQLDPSRWLRKPLKGDPFCGTTPLAFITRTGTSGIRATIRFILQSGLRMSVSG